MVVLVVDWHVVRAWKGSVEGLLALVGQDVRSAGAWASDYIESNHLERSEVIRRSRLNQTFAYQILAGARNASRDKLIQLAFGLRLGIEECSELLEHGGTNALATSSRRDVVIAYCLDRGIDLSICDDMLWDCGERTLAQG